MYKLSYFSCLVILEIFNNKEVDILINSYETKCYTIYDHYLEFNDTVLNNTNYKHTLAVSFV